MARKRVRFVLNREVVSDEILTGTAAFDLVRETAERVAPNGPDVLVETYDNTVRAVARISANASRELNGGELSRALGGKA